MTVVDLGRARAGTADLGEVLARTEGVGVRRSGGLGSRTRLSLNGFTDDQVRILLDGVPLDMSGFGLGVSSIPLDFLDRVEIYQGVVPIELEVQAAAQAVTRLARLHQDLGDAMAEPVRRRPEPGAERHHGDAHDATDGPDREVLADPQHGLLNLVERVL